MTFQFRPDRKSKGRNKYVDSWKESACQLIPLPFSPESLHKVLEWGACQDNSPHTHQEIVHWCDQMHMQFLDADEAPDMEAAIRIAADVDCQWDLFLANSFTLEQLQKLDFSLVRLPKDWFMDWQRQLKNTEKKG